MSEVFNFVCQQFKVVSKNLKIQFHLFVCLFVYLFIYFLVDEQTIESKDITRSVFSVLHDAMTKVQSCPSYQGVRYEFGLKCDLCVEEKTPCLRHEKEACTDPDCVCILTLECLKKDSAVCPRNRCGKNSLELHKTIWVNATGKKMCFS